MCVMAVIYSLFFLCIFISLCVEVSTSEPACVHDTKHKDKWRKEEFPNPQIDIDKCGRNCTASWVCDPGNIISIKEADHLDKLINEVRMAGTGKCTECTKNDGYNISIALVPAINITSKVTLDHAASFATYLLYEWKFEKCKNDVIILITRDDRKVYTRVGMTTYRILTHECIQEVYNRVKPMLSGDLYADGLAKMITDYKTILSHGSCDDYISKPNTVGIIIGCLVGIIALGILLCLVFHICKRQQRRSYSKTKTDEQSKGLPVALSSGNDILIHTNTDHQHSSSGGGKSSNSTGYSKVDHSHGDFSSGGGGGGGCRSSCGGGGCGSSCGGSSCGGGGGGDF